MNALLAELIGTAIIIVFGAGVVANVVLSRTKGNGSGWIVISWGWAIGVFVGVFCSQDASGAHLSPAISFALALSGTFPWASVSTSNTRLPCAASPAATLTDVVVLPVPPLWLNTAR